MQHKAKLIPCCRLLAFLTLYVDPKTRKAAPMLYRGRLGSDFSNIFEVLNLDLGVWTALDPAPVPTPPFTRMRPFIQMDAFNPGMAIYFDTDERFLWFYSSGHWTRMATNLERTDYRGGRNLVMPKGLLYGYLGTVVCF